MAAENEYYYCMDHKTVEPWDGCRSGNRLGPYNSRDEAQQALSTVEQRNEQWDNDPKWNDDAEEQGADERRQ
ncbi:SPOR domain-containing protein [Mariniluteicoccus flavus]